MSKANTRIKPNTGVTVAPRLVLSAFSNNFSFCSNFFSFSTSFGGRVGDGPGGVSMGPGHSAVSIVGGLTPISERARSLSL